MHPLERARKAAAYSQRELAVAAGVPRATVQNIEQGRTRTPHPSTWRKLAGVLGVAPSELMATVESEAEQAAVG